jgi:signal transduction histidine kinase
VAAAEGVRLPVVLDDADLPRPARLAVAERRAVAEAGDGFSLGSGGGIYFPLMARSRLIGLIAVETRATGVLGRRELEVGAALAPQAALAIDNGRWFSRLRRVGADEERIRIARDLHDRVGQSLAFVSFELDRISRKATNPDVEDELHQLRDQVRLVVTEVRDTLYDLRTDVSERKDLVTTLADFADRLGERTHIDVRFDFQAERRLDLPKEREVWRIAQEAVTNAFRHSGAETVNISWRCGGGGGVLEVIDNGRGIAKEATGLAGNYGIVGMRERAAAIGARLEIGPAAGGGTLVRCEVPG